MLEILRCSLCGGFLALKPRIMEGPEIIEGELDCEDCKALYPVRRGIPRMTGDGGYSASWGILWNKTGKLLRDSFTGLNFYENVLFGEFGEQGAGVADGNIFGFGWPREMAGSRILEVGPGTGVCTEHLAGTGAEIVAVDMSDSVDSLPTELVRLPNVHVIQGDVNSRLFEKKAFDRIWLYQVLQHTPEPLLTIKRLRLLLKTGGRMSFTSYDRPFYPWYLWLTQKFTFEQVYVLVRLLLPVKYHLQRIFFNFELDLAASAVHRLTRIVDPRNLYFKIRTGTCHVDFYNRIFEKFEDERIRTLYIAINTFDTITPLFTNGADHETVRKWCETAGFENPLIWGVSGVRATVVR